MPSRSPEPPSGATRDEAIAAARAEFGADVRIRGVRRIRTGGVAGFFSSERYVAEVVEPTDPPVAPAPATPALTTAQAIAQWPAAGLSVDDLLAVAQEVSRAQRSSAGPAAVAAVDPVDPVEELADLFGAGPADVDVYSPTSLARPAAARRAEPELRPLTQRRAEEPVGPQAPTWERTSRQALAADPAPKVEDDLPADDDAPLSPFTAALARMVTHDDEVQTAVAGATEEAARAAEDEERRAAEDLTRALAQERAHRRARAAATSPVVETPAVETPAVQVPAADGDAVDEVAAARELRQAAVLESERRVAARLRAGQQAQDAEAEAEAAAAGELAARQAEDRRVEAQRVAAARAEANARRAAAREAEVAELARVELARAEAEAWEQQARRETAPVQAARAEAARAVAAQETARFGAPALRAVPHRDPRRAGPPPPDRAADRRAAALRAAGRQAEQQVTELRSDHGVGSTDRAERLRAVLAALPATMSEGDALPAPLAGTPVVPVTGEVLPRPARALPVVVPVPVAVVTSVPPRPLPPSVAGPATAPVSAPPAPPRGGWVLAAVAAIAAGHRPPAVADLPPPVAPPTAPPGPPAAPQLPPSSQSIPREEAQQVSMDQPVVESSPVPDAGVDTPRRGLSDGPPRTGGRASRRAADRRAAEPAPVVTTSSAGDDLWGSPASVLDPAGRHRPLGSPADPGSASAPAQRKDEQLEALRAAALAGTGSTPRRRRTDDGGRHRPAGTGVQSVVTAVVTPVGPPEAEGTLVAVVHAADPLHTPDHASGFLEAIAAVAGSGFLGDAPGRPDLASEVSGLLVEEMAQEMAAGMADELARTASDPAPLSMDATTVLPPLSSLLSTPAAVPRVRGPRPPVPPARGVSRSRVAPPHPTTRGRSAPVEPQGLATVTQLLTSAPVTAPAAPVTAPAPVGLAALGLPSALLGDDFGADATARGTFAALTSVLSRVLPAAPSAPSEPGDVLVVVGPGAEALSAARVLATSLRLDPARVQWATRGELSGLSSPDVGVSTAAVAAARREAAAGAGVPTVVAVDVPLRDAGSAWVAQMLQAWAPTTVWGVLDATRKPADLTGWLAALPRVDAVVVTDTESSADPAALLAGLPVPVAVVDGARATAHRWAALLCERLASRS